MCGQTQAVVLLYACTSDCEQQVRCRCIVACAAQPCHGLDAFALGTCCGWAQHVHAMFLPCRCWQDDADCTSMNLQLQANNGTSAALCHLLLLLLLLLQVCVCLCSVPRSRHCLGQHGYQLYSNTVCRTLMRDSWQQLTAVVLSRVLCVVCCTLLSALWLFCHASCTRLQ